MRNWSNTVMISFLQHCTLFFLGAYGDVLFAGVHSVIANSDSQSFGMMCNLATAILLLVSTHSGNEE